MRLLKIRWKDKWIKGAVLVMGGVVAAYCAMMLALAIAGVRAQPQAADVAVVLGSQVLPSGKPSARLRARLDRAVEIYRQKLAENMIVSGGLGREGFDEARVMKAYLAAHGVPAERIYEDNQGDNTWLTGRHAAELMRRHGWKSAIVVTQFFHVARSRLALRRWGVTPVYGAAAHYGELRDLYATGREVPAYLVYFCRSRPPEIVVQQ